MKTRKLGLRKKPSGYWVTGMPVYYTDGEGPFTECGPYKTRAEAQEERLGLETTLNKMGWEDGERPQGKKADGSSSRKVVKTKSFQEVVQANKPQAIKAPVKVVKPKPKAVKTKGLF